MFKSAKPASQQVNLKRT